MVARQTLFRGKKLDGEEKMDEDDFWPTKNNAYQALRLVEWFVWGLFGYSLYRKDCESPRLAPGLLKCIRD